MNSGGDGRIHGKHDLGAPVSLLSDEICKIRSGP